jgi:hypothetical protein
MLTLDAYEKQIISVTSVIQWAKLIVIIIDRLCGLVVRVFGYDPEARVRFPALPEK